MAKIIWSDEALADLRAIFDYLAQGSPVYAERYVADVYDRVQILAQHPEIGKAVSEWQDPYFPETRIRKCTDCLVWLRCNPHSHRFKSVAME